MTLGDETYCLDDPFLVMATQNPIEQEGTYPLPEAQVDRFMLKIKVGYPGREEERRILERMAGGGEVEVDPVVALDDVRRLRAVVQLVYMDDKIKDYIVNLVYALAFPRRSASRTWSTSSNTGHPLERRYSLPAPPALTHSCADGLT